MAFSAALSFYPPLFELIYKVCHLIRLEYIDFVVSLEFHFDTFAIATLLRLLDPWYGKA